MEMPVFESHNVCLSDGTQTSPKSGEPVNRRPWFLSAVATLSLVFGENLRGLRIADVGCGEGGYAAEFARLGMDALGIDVRERNIVRCEFLRQSLGLPNLRYVKDDVGNIGTHGKFDAVFCVGLFYHLDNPIAFLRQLSASTKRALFLQTHFAREHESPAVTGYRLSPVQINEGVRGRWFKEHDGFDAKELEHDRFRGTSWHNEKSFWVAKPDLIQAMKNSGFKIVVEQFDALGDDIARSMRPGGYRHQHDRSMLVGIKF